MARTAVGWELLAGLTGEGFGALLANWGASLYLDERVASGSYAMPSWNLREIFGELGVSVKPNSFMSREEPFRVVLGSSLYFLVGGGQSARTAISLQGTPDPSGSGFLLPGISVSLPAHLQVFVVRLP